MSEQIAERSEEIDALCRKHGVLSLAVFGSAARGELEPGSDVDLLIEFKPDSGIVLLQLHDIQAAFEALFGRAVNLAGPEILRNPYPRRAILRDLRPLYGARLLGEDQEDRVAVRARAWEKSLRAEQFLARLEADGVLGRILGRR